MRNLIPLVKALYADESGQDLVEYALIAVLVALVAISGLTSLGSTIASKYNSITSTVGAQ